jgi:acetyl-CoA acetyltransferase
MEGTQGEHRSVRVRRGPHPARTRPSGALHGTKPVDLVTGLIHETLSRFPDLDPAAIDDIARTAAVAAGLPDTVAGVQENRFCAPVQRPSTWRP